MNNYIIIGAAGGIGVQLVADLQAKGNKLFLGYHKNLLAYPRQGNLQSASVDATSFNNTLDFISDGKKILGNVDGIVNLAGSILLKSPHRITEKEFDNIISTNLKSAYSVVRAAGKVLSNASVILMSTAAVRIGLPNHEAIVAAKAGIEAIVRSASITYARKSIRFNAVAPGLVDTPLSSAIMNNPSSLEYSKNLHVTSSVGKPKDISSMLQFLLDPNNNWITGQTFPVDGGLSIAKK